MRLPGLAELWILLFCTFQRQHAVQGMAQHTRSGMGSLRVMLAAASCMCSSSCPRLVACLLPFVHAKPSSQTSQDNAGQEGRMQMHSPDDDAEKKEPSAML